MLLSTVIPSIMAPMVTSLSDMELSDALSKVVIDPTYSHAMEEHPVDAPIVRKCFEQKGAYMQFQVQRNRRYLRVCLINETAGLVGFQIVDIVDKVAKEKTAYIKESIKNIRDLLNYADRMGYPRFRGPL